jgi:hypothetical protein
MEEMLNVLQLGDAKATLSYSEHSDNESELLILSVCAAAGTSDKKTLRLQGMCGKQEMLILVDSGNSTSFLSQAWAKQAHVQTQSVEPVQVSVANGAKLTNDQRVPEFSWLTQGYTFTLQCYDMILGMD